MNKLIAVSLVGLLLACGVGILLEKNMEISDDEPMQYQGPVPLNYDLEHFRDTGETIPISGGER